MTDQFCASCTTEITSDQRSVHCLSCKKYFHTKCKSLNGANLQSIKKHGYFCSDDLSNMDLNQIHVWQMEMCHEWPQMTFKFQHRTTRTSNKFHQMILFNVRIPTILLPKKHLTRFFMDVYKTAALVKDDIKFQFLCIQNGQILMKKEEKSKDIYWIQAKDDLNV
jgi:hypothetical protein